MEKTPREPAQHGGSSIIKTNAELATEEDLTHEYEKRDCSENKAIGDFPGDVGGNTKFAQEKDAADDSSYSQPSSHWHPDKRSRNTIPKITRVATAHNSINLIPLKL
ncbi:hypothetical protein ES703_59213 [subsurface metagenome]